MTDLEKIKSYIKNNKDKYSKESINQQLRDVNVKEEEINKAWSFFEENVHLDESKKTQVLEKSKKRGFIISVFIILILSGVGYFLYSSGYLSFIGLGVVDPVNVNVNNFSTQQVKEACQKVTEIKWDYRVGEDGKGEIYMPQDNYEIHLGTHYEESLEYMYCQDLIAGNDLSKYGDNVSGLLNKKFILLSNIYDQGGEKAIFESEIIVEENNLSECLDENNTIISCEKKLVDLNYEICKEQFKFNKEKFVEIYNNSIFSQAEYFSIDNKNIMYEDILDYNTDVETMIENVFLSNCISERDSRGSNFNVLLNYYDEMIKPINLDNVEIFGGGTLKFDLSFNDQLNDYKKYLGLDESKFSIVASRIQGFDEEQKAKKVCEESNLELEQIKDFNLEFDNCILDNGKLHKLTIISSHFVSDLYFEAP
jgi:hypothetical protein